MSLNVSEVVSALQKYFISFDLRTLAFKHQDTWINIVSSLFFSEESIEDTIKKHKTIRQPEIKGLRLFTYSDNVTKFESISHQMKEGGLIRLVDPLSNNEEVILTDNFDPQLLTIFEHPFRAFPPSEWKVYDAVTKKEHPNRQYGWKLLEEHDGLFITLGFDNVYQWIDYSLGMSGYKKGDENTFIIGLPIKAKINEIHVNKNIVKLIIKSHKNLSNLQVNIFREELNFQGYFKPIDRDIIELTCPNSYKNDYILYNKEITFSKIHPKDNIEAQLFSKNISKLKIDTKYCRPPLENSLEPLIRSLENFCNLKYFENELINPEKISLKKKNIKQDPSWIFEEAVSWLLSLGGLSVIRLGEKEKIALDSGVELSADILAYKENDYLFIIDCDIQHADPKKGSTLKQIADLFKPIQNEVGKPEIIPVLFTPKEPIIGDIGGGVIVINGQKIESLIRKAVEGDKDGFCSILSSQYRYV